MDTIEQGLAASEARPSRRRILGGGLALGGAAWVTPSVIGVASAAAASEIAACTCIDFDERGITEAQNISATQPYAGLGIRLNSFDDINRPLFIFNTAAPTGGDTDLGTPNTDFGGPGIGAGGGAGQPGENANALGQVLIINERPDPPADDNAPGGTITITFADPVFFESVELLDIEEGGHVRAYAGDTLLSSVPLMAYGGNSYQRVDVLQSGVTKVEIFSTTSYAVPSFCYCPE